MEKNHKELINKAKEVLEKNWMGYYTQPASKVYPHQWNWDSAFIAIGYSHYDQEKAQLELLSLLRGQWENGMVPHIVFNPEIKDYFPGAFVWASQKSPESAAGVITSGIIQPPLLATAAKAIYENGQNKSEARQFLRRIYPQLRKFHQYLYNFRDPQSEGLVFIRHPWESGIDNSPLWDEPLARVKIPKGLTFPRVNLKHVPAEERPSQEDYNRYLCLVEVFKKNDYQEDKIFKESPFLIQDVLFNSLLHQSNEDLLEIASVIGEETDEIKRWLRKTGRRINKKLWHEEKGGYYDFDLVTQKPIFKESAANFMPLFAGVASGGQAEKLYEHLNSRCFCKIGEKCYSLPNYDKFAPEFEPANYWRGPIWININWLLYKGLNRYGYREYAEYVKNSILQLVERSGFYEYFDPDSGEGYGVNNFSWTAALLVDILLSE